MATCGLPRASRTLAGRALLPRLAAVVAAHKDDYQGHDWQGRYLAILAQAASGTGDQEKGARALRDG